MKRTIGRLALLIMLLGLAETGGAEAQRNPDVLYRDGRGVGQGYAVAQATLGSAAAASGAPRCGDTSTSMLHNSRMFVDPPGAIV